MTRSYIVLAALLGATSLLFAAEQPIALDTATGVIQGTLTTPAGAAKTPVVVIISGSGPTDRDGNTPLAAGRNDSLKLLAAALQSQGIASVRYDKRGVAGSVKAARQESDLRIEDYVQDASSWAAKVAADARFTGVVMLGHSEGSLIGMLAAQRSPVSAFISIAGPAEKASVVLRRQLQGRLPPNLVERNEAILSALEAGRTPVDVPPALAASYRPSVQPYLMSWFKYSPAQELAKLTVPCLIVQGSTDSQVDVSAAQALHAARAECGMKVIPGMNHVLKMVAADRGQQLASYSDPTLPLAPELTQALEQFFVALPVRLAPEK
jgi:alpha-beta hydrolase superfamily lysophospholipase